MKKLFTLCFALLMANAAMSQIPNGGFETWTTPGSYDIPTGWDNLNATTSPSSVYTCEKGTPGNPGASYLRLTSKPVTGLGVVPGVAICGTLDPTTHLPKSGFPYTSRPGNLTGSWQFMEFGSGSDPGRIMIFLSKWNITLSRRDTIAFTDYVLPGMVMSWATFSIPLTYHSLATPDSAIIFLSSSSATPVANSYLFVDDLAFSGTAPTSLGSFTSNSPLFSLYPNPVNGIVTVLYNSGSETNVNISVADVSGRNLYTITQKVIRGENNATLNLSNFSKGIYFIRLTDGMNTQVRKLIIE